jgi:replicative DNA helicase
MPDLFEKGAREGEMDIEAMKKLYEAMFKSLLDVAKGAQPGLQIEKKLPLEIEKKKRGVAKEPQPQEQEAAVDDTLTVDKTEQQKKEQQQAVDDDFTVDKTKKTKKEQQPEPYGRVFGSGVNKLTESDCKTLAAIMSAKKGAIIADSDYDYVVKYNGKVLFETTMGEITTHKKLPPELYNKIAALSPDPKTFDKLRDKLTDAADWLKPETADWGRSGENIPFRQSSVGLPIVDLIDTPLADLIDTIAVDLIDTPKSNGRHPLAKQRVAEISNAINSPEADNTQARSVEEINKPQLLSEDSPTIEEADYNPDDFFQDIEGVDEENLEHVDAEPSIINKAPEVEKPKLATKDQEVAINPVPETVSKSPHIDQLVSLMIDRVTADMAVVKDSASQAKGIVKHYMEMVRSIPAGIIPNNTSKSFEAVKGMFEEIAQDAENELNQEIAPPVTKAPTTEKPVLKQEIATTDPHSFYNFEAQENLIGKILLEPAAFQKSLSAGVSEKSFTPGLHQDIFLAAKAITDEDKQVNGETIAKVMDSTQPNIRTDLATILARNAPGTSVDSIAEVVREKQIRRDMDRMAADLGKSAHDKTQPVFQTLRSNQNHATSIANGSYAISQQPPSLKNDFAPDNLKNVGSERLIIAAILNTAHPIKDLAVTGLTSKAFTDPDHQEIFRAAETLHEKGLENNLMTIRNQVSYRAAFKASEIASNVTPQMVKEPIANVMGLAQRRDLVDVSDKLAAAAAQPGTSKAELLEILGKAKEDIKSVSSKSPKLPEIEVTTTVLNTVEKSNNISRGR